MSTADALRATALVILVVDLSLVIYLMRRAEWFKPTGWVILFWGILNALFNIMLLIPGFKHLFTDSNINDLSQGLRLTTYLSLFVILVLILDECRKAKL